MSTPVRNRAKASDLEENGSVEDILFDKAEMASSIGEMKGFLDDYEQVIEKLKKLKKSDGSVEQKILRLEKGQKILIERIKKKSEGLSSSD